MADQIVEFFNKLGQADPVGIFTAILILCVIAICLAAETTSSDGSAGSAGWP